MLSNIENCYGCMGCYNICPVKAIKIEQNLEGFYIPKINREKCINCGRCEDVCQMNEKLVSSSNIPLNIYAAWSKNNKIRMKSSSGGIFYHLALKVIKKNGVVYGAAMQENNVLEHVRVTKEKELVKLLGSKYIQSNIKTIYQQVKIDLDNEKYVLFSGTPCQIVGLKNYLGKYSNKLLTCDFICHGVPSPIIFDGYLKSVRNKYNSEIRNVQFRDKRIGWEIYSLTLKLENKKKVTHNLYMDSYLRAFLRNHCLNEQCYICPYANEKRFSDITMGDFWGYSAEKFRERNDDRGISMILINTKLGSNIYEEIKKDIISIEKNVKESIQKNPGFRQSLSKKTKERFWEDYFSSGYDIVEKKYMMPEKLNWKECLRISVVGTYLKRIKEILRLLR